MIQLRRLLADSRGAQMVEYIVLVGLVLAAVGAFTAFRGKLFDKADQQKHTIDTE